MKLNKSRLINMESDHYLKTTKSYVNLSSRDFFSSIIVVHMKYYGCTYKILLLKKKKPLTVTLHIHNNEFESQETNS